MSNKIKNIEEEYEELKKNISEDGLDIEENSSVYNQEKKPFDINKIDIISTTKTIEQICRRIEYQEIELEPDFQRAKVWSLEQKSKLIESILLKIPLPTFYVYVKEDEENSGGYNIDNDKWVVIDGLQRLSTLYDFYNDKFKLEKLEYLIEFNGTKFKDFKDNKYRQQYRALTETELLIYVVKPNTPKEIASDIFARINTLGSPLSSQELRHALNLGKSTKLLKKLSKFNSFEKAITKSSLTRMKRMADRELILRLLSFKIQGIDKYGKSISKFLTDSMEIINKEYTNKDIEDIEHFFDRVMNKSFIVFGEYAFRKIKLNDKNRRPISKTLFETIGYYIDEYTENDLKNKKEKLFNAFKEAMTNDIDYFNSLSYSTNTKKVVQTRFNKTKNIFEKVMKNA